MAIAPAVLRLIALLATCQLQGAHAKGTTTMMKEMFCAQIKISMICGKTTAGGAAAAPATCTGTSCCPKSSCYSNMVPQFTCKSSRGATKCVGGSMIGFKKGVCMCKSGACSATGDCSGTASSFPRLYDDAEATPIEEEDFSAAFTATGLLSIALVAAVASFALRGVRRVTRRAAAVKTAVGGEAGLMGSAVAVE